MVNDCAGLERRVPAREPRLTPKPTRRSTRANASLRPVATPAGRFGRDLSLHSCAGRDDWPMNGIRYALEKASAIGSRSHWLAPMALVRRIAYSSAMTQPHRPVGPGDHVFLVDGSSFVFRAYYQSIRQDQKYNYRSDRLPIGAVRLFATKMLQFVRDGAAGIKPTHLAIIFDKSENSFRARTLSALQEPSARSARRSRAAVSADARDRARLRHDPGRAGPLRGGRPDRHLRAPGARKGRRRADRLGRQGPDAAHRARRGDVRSGFGRPRGAAHRPEPRWSNISARGADKVVDIQALAGDFDRQRARRARHRRQDRRAAHRRIWRSRHAARPRGRDQAAEAPRGADPAGERRAHPHLEDAGHAGARRRRSRRRSTIWRTPTLDGKELVAFFKAMELTTITRRVGEICGVDISAIEPDPRFVGPAAGGAATARRRWRASSRPAAAAPAQAAGRPPLAAPEAPTPADSSGARAAEARAPDRPRRLRDGRARLEELQRLDRARARGGPCRLRHRDDLARPAAGRVSSACRSRSKPGRGLLRPDRPSRRGRTTCSAAAASRRTRSGEAGGDRASEAAAGGAGRPQDRSERQVRHAGVRPARRDRRADRRHDADFLRARRRRDRRRPRHGRARPSASSATSRSRFSEVAGSGRNFIGFARVADRQGDRIRRRGRRRDPAPVAAS